MAIFINSNYLLFVAIQYLVFSSQTDAIPYDHSFTTECLEEPQGPLYKGGMLANSKLNQGLNGWTAFADATIEHRSSDNGNKYVVASNRSRSFHSFSQTHYLKKDLLYTFSAWFQLSNAEADVAAIFQTNSSNVTVGWATARKGCWSMMKGGLAPEISGPAQLYFASNNTEVDIFGDSFSLQSFTNEEWRSHQENSIEKVRKTSVRLQVLDVAGHPIPNATVSLKQKKADFPFGCAMNQNILRNPGYQTWYLSKFRNRYTVFENELKWYSNEYIRGFEDYTAADAMVKLAKANNINIRGHNVLWANALCQPRWVPGLSNDELAAAANKRLNSVVSRYKDQLIHWDVVNENLHFNFFETRLNDPNASTEYYQKANTIDPNALPFLNEYNTIEWPEDPKASPQKYLQRILDMRAQGYNRSLGIGVQGHFPANPNLPAMRASLDVLAHAGLPIWVTEMDVAGGPSQAYNLNQSMYELFSHPAVKGIILWSAWSQGGCYVMCLTDNNFANLATGDVVDAFMNQLSHSDCCAIHGRAMNSDGVFEVSLHHGIYQVEINDANGVVRSSEINVRPDDEASRVYQVTIDNKY